MRSLIGLLLTSLTGCAYLRPVTAEEKTLVTTRACAQGPLRIETQTLGARWGEWYELRLVAPRGLNGNLRWRIADDRRLKERWVTSYRVKEGKDERDVVDTVFNQARCIERPAVQQPVWNAAPAPQWPVAQPSPAVQPQPAWNAQPAPAVVQPQQPAWNAPPAPQPQWPVAQPVPAVVQPQPEWNAPPQSVRVEVSIPVPQQAPPVVVTQPEPGFEPLEFPRGPDLSPVQLVVGGERSREHFTVLMRWERRNEDKNAPPPVPAGQPVVIEIWSEQPNDYEGAAFLFARGALEPNVTEAEWIAELDKREAERSKEAADDAARLAEENRRRAEAHTKQVAIDNERRRIEYAELEKRRAANIAAREAKLAEPKVETAYERERKEKYAAGLAAPSRPDAEYIEARRRELERQKAEAAAEAEARRRWQEESERRWREAEARRPKPRPEPTGPPPPAPAQSVPLKPAPYVLWIDGYYEWTGQAWVWLEGWWKVNEAERARYEYAARLPAPAPRVETPPPCPVPQGQWQAGTWVWNLEVWVWLPGVWLSTQRPVHQAVPVTPKN